MVLLKLFKAKYFMLHNLVKLNTTRQRLIDLGTYTYLCNAKGTNY